jgi:cytochrome c5
MNSNSVKSSAVVLICVMAFATYLFAGSHRATDKETAVTPVVQATDANTMRLQGEQRFRANCGRCHATPQKFSPRTMATVVRHMRVRALITDEDMRLILFYMTQ